MNAAPLRAPWLQTIADAFSARRVYAVGGAVRNTLMGLPVSDVDLCGAARPAEVQALCEGTGITAKLRAAHFGTVELHLDGHMAEYTTFRRDSYRGGHQPFAVRFADSLEEDALRRDFSVNALYAALDDPETVLDPTGGLKHLEARVLYTVTPDPDQVFKDDGLRILRAARFQAELGLVPADAVLASARTFARLLDEIAAERKRDEITKLLTADVKYPSLLRTTPAVSSGLQTLVRVGAWERLFGGLEPIGFPALDHAAALGAGGKLALLYLREAPGKLTGIMTALRFSKRETGASSEALAAAQSVIRRESLSEALRFGVPALQTAETMLSAFAAADPAYQSASGLARQMLHTIARDRLPAGLRELAVGGHDLLRFCRETGMPKERIGSVLSALWRDAVNGLVPNNKAALLRRARGLRIDSENHG